MKTLKLFRNALLCSLCVLLFHSAGWAQTLSIESATPPVPADTLSLTPATPIVNSPWYARALSFKQGVESNRSVTVAIYPSYAPALKINGQSKPWGFGAAAFYPLSDHTFTGFRMDYLAGDFFAAQAAVGAKGDMQILTHTFTGLVFTSLLLPVQGAADSNFKPGNATGVGVTTHVYDHTYSSGKVNYVSLAYQGERWTVPGSVLDGLLVHHVAVAFTLKF